MRTMDALPFGATTLGAEYDGLQPVPVIVLLDNVRSLYNVGAFFRTADGAGVERIVLAGITAAPPNRGIAKTALGAEERVAFTHVGDGVAAAGELRAAGYELAAVETSLRAVDLYDWRPRFPVCVMFGHEVDGLSPALLEMADTHIRLPMLGVKQSLNVATAGGVVLYELLRQYRALRQARDVRGARG